MKIEEELYDPDLVFHHTSAQTAMEHILHTGKIRFSPMEEMNDPYEYQMRSSGGIVSYNYDRDRHRSLSLFLREAVLRRSKIACFSSFPSEQPLSGDLFSHPYAKPRSWAQYGDIQRGVCLVFNKNKLLANAQTEFEEVEIYDGNVNYSLGDGHASAKATIHDDDKVSIEENVYRHLQANKNDVYFRKYADFRDEAEYRIVVVDKSKIQSQYLLSPIDDALKYIVLGDKFSEVYFGLILQLAEKYSAKALTLRYGRVPYINALLESHCR